MGDILSQQPAYLRAMIESEQENIAAKFVLPPPNFLGQSKNYLLLVVEKITPEPDKVALIRRVNTHGDSATAVVKRYVLERGVYPVAVQCFERFFVMRRDIAFTGYNRAINIE